MMFSSRNEEIRRLEKKIENLEKRTGRNFVRLNDSLNTVTDVIIRLEKENSELKKDRDFLLEKQKELLRSVETENRLIKEMREKFIEPAREGLRQDIELVKQAISDDYKSKKDELLDMVMRQGRIKVKEAARKLNVHNVQIETWAQDFEKAGLVQLDKEELRKKS